MRTSFPLASLLAIPLFLSSCATIVSKSKYPVSVSTEPTKISVTVTDQDEHVVFKGNSPAAFKLKSGAGFFKKGKYNINVSAPGYQEQNVPVNFKLNGWYFGNILIGGVIGLLIIDPATGAMWKIDKDDYYVSMEQKTKTTTAGSSLHIKLKQDISKEEAERMVRIK